MGILISGYNELEFTENVFLGGHTTRTKYWRNSSFIVHSSLNSTVIDIILENIPGYT